MTMDQDLEKTATENIVSLSKESPNPQPTHESEELERKQFMQELNKFSVEIGKPLSKIPIMGYKELDLFQLSKEVIAYGGFNEVVKNVGTWSKIWKRLANFDPSITDSSFRLKKNYERYLLEYEFAKHPDHRKQAMELERQLQLKRIESNDKQKKTDKTSPKAKKNLNKRRKAYAALKEVPRDKNGAPKMPLVLSGGELTVENLGDIVPKSPYVTEKHIWPIGYRSSRFFASTLNPSQRVKYTCEILDAGDRPQFIVTASDDPHNPIVSNSPSGVWRIILKRITDSKDKEVTPPSSPSSTPSSPAPSSPVNSLSYSGDSVPKNAARVRGTLQFGLAHTVVSQLIRELPNADKCLDLLTSDKKKRKRCLSSSSDVESMEENTELLNNLKSFKPSPKEEVDEVSLDEDDHFSQRDVEFTSRQEIDDMESAVATLYSLRNSAFF